MHDTRMVKHTIDVEVRDAFCVVCEQLVYTERLQHGKWLRHSVEHPHVKLSFELHAIRDEESNAPGTPFSEGGRSELSPRLCIGCVLDEGGFEAVLGHVFPHFEFSTYGRGSAQRKRPKPPEDDAKEDSGK